MPTRIDHVIAGALDFRSLEATFVRLGFHVTGGGIHPWGGTRNRIIVLGDGYLELLGVADRAKVSEALAGRLEAAGASWVGFALQSADIEREVTQMRERGADARGPIAGQLVAPSGAIRGWRTVLLGREDHWAAAEPLPFLIQHHSRGAVHQVELGGAGGLAPHPNGVERLAEVAVAVRDLDEACRAFEQAYGLRPTGTTQRDEGLMADVSRLPLDSGERIALARPYAEGVASRRIERVGEGVCRASVTANVETTAAWLRSRGIAYEEGSGWLDVVAVDGLGIPLRFAAE